MDRVYGAYNANATEKICIGGYFKQYANLLTPVEYANLNNIFFEEAVFSKLQQACSVDHLSFDDEPSGKHNTKDAAQRIAKIPDDTQLETLRKLKRKYSVEGGGYQRKGGEYMKYQSELPITYEWSSTMEHKATPNKDTFVSIRVYFPFKCEGRGKDQKRHKITLSNVIIMLGSQTLDQLRDKISCVSDLTGVYDFSTNPVAAKKAVANRDIYKSGFFFIEDTFYNDTRDSDNADYSDVIRKWAEPRGFGPFQTAKMEGVRLDSLTLRFGYPWVYQHQGSCEHLIVFSDARLVNADDDLDVSHYPKIDRVKHIRTPVCMMCNQRSYHWLVKGSDRVPHDPCYFCDQCFQSFHYVDGKKLGSFRAYRYPYDPAIVKMGSESLSENED